MVTNFGQTGANLTIPAPAAVLSSESVFAGEILGIALGDADLGSSPALATNGVFTLSKVAIDVATLGSDIYWGPGAELATIDDNTDANAKLGIAVEAIAAATGTVKFRIAV